MSQTALPLPETLADEIACVERELALRKRVYPRLVAKRRMTQGGADRELRLMRAVLARLERCKVRGET